MVGEEWGGGAGQDVTFGCEGFFAGGLTAPPCTPPLGALPPDPQKRVAHGRRGGMRGWRRCCPGLPTLACVVAHPRTPRRTPRGRISRLAGGACCGRWDRFVAGACCGRRGRLARGACCGRWGGLAGGACCGRWGRLARGACCGRWDRFVAGAWWGLLPDRSLWRGCPGHHAPFPNRMRPRQSGLFDCVASS